MPKIFLSYVFEDHAYRDQVADWSRRAQLGNFEVVFERDDVRQMGEAAIARHLRPIMRGADALLVLVGQDTHSRRWVDEEIHFCASAGKPIVWARIPNTTGAAPIEIRGRDPLVYAPKGILDGLAAALRQ